MSLSETAHSPCTRTQFLGVSLTQIDATLQEFATNTLAVVFGREHQTIISKLWTLIRTGSRSDLSASKEFAICVAECVVWVFAHIHNRWCVKDPNSFQTTTEVRMRADAYPLHTLTHSSAYTGAIVWRPAIRVCNSALWRHRSRKQFLERASADLHEPKLPGVGRL